MGSICSLPIVLGFHGTTRSVAESVLLGKILDLSPSKNDYDWLGRGIYFWENAPERAADWALDVAERLQGKDDPFVLGAYISLGTCMNLLDVRYQSHIAALHQAILDKESTRLKDNSGNPIVNGKYLHCLDRLVIEYFVDRAEAQPNGIRFDTVRGCFPEGNPAFPGSSILEKTHVQIAVRNPESVVGYFRPKDMKNLLSRASERRKKRHS